MIVIIIFIKMTVQEINNNISAEIKEFISRKGSLYSSKKAFCDEALRLRLDQLKKEVKL